MTEPRPPYRRILLKVSGEVLMGDAPFGIDMATLDAVAADIAAVASRGIELCLVIGGGNIFTSSSGKFFGSSTNRSNTFRCAMSRSSA